MKKIVFMTIVATLLILGRAGAQNNTFKAFFTAIDASCYNNGKVAFGIISDNGLPLSELPESFSEVRAYYKIGDSDSAHYTGFYFGGVDTMFLNQGSYIVGLEALSSDGSGGYIKLDTHTTIVIGTNYTKPKMSLLSSIPKSVNDCGTMHSLSCVNTGRVQFKITDGRFPYTVKVLDSETSNELKTLVFNEKQYDGIYTWEYNYKDYYTIDSLPAGKWDFYMTDGCGYGMPRASLEIKTVSNEILSGVYLMSGSGNFADSNVVKFSLSKNNGNNYYNDILTKAIKYRVVCDDFPATSWKTIGENMTYIFDTIHDAHSYCELYDKTLKFEYEVSVCGTVNKVKNFTLNQPSATLFVKDSVYVIDTAYFSSSKCSQIMYYHTDYYKIGFNKSYEFSSNMYESSTRRYFYTYPLIWIYTDIESGNIIKRDTVDRITDVSYLYNSEVRQIYNNYDSCLILKVERKLIDGKGCTLYSTSEKLEFNFYENEKRPGWKIKTEQYNKCITSKRSVILEECNLEQGNIDSTVVRLVRSPLNNRYNFEAVYYKAANQWVIKKSNVENVATIRGEHYGKRLIIEDYGLPSGPYEFEIFTRCDTTFVSTKVSFYDIKSTEMVKKPTSVIESKCSVSNLSYEGGLMMSLSWNTSVETGLPLPVDTTYEDINYGIYRWPNTNTISYSMKSISSPTTISEYGTYVILFRKNSSTNECYKNYYDTIYYELKTIEFDYAVALLCDSSSTTGSVFAAGINGTKPYTYTLYDSADKKGNILGVNNSGVFRDIPMQMSSTLSCVISDSCDSYFHVNITPWSLAELQKTWFDGGLKATSSCEGSVIQVHALQIGNILQYEWTGPGGFYDTLSQPLVFVPRGSESGWYKVRLKNIGCDGDLYDSIYFEVQEAPYVKFSGDTTVCKGQNVPFAFVASSSQEVDSMCVTLIFENEFEKFSRHYKLKNGEKCIDSLLVNYDTKIFSIKISDGICDYQIADDTLRISTFDNISGSCNVTATGDTICFGGNASVLAKSDIEAPFFISWYADSSLNVLLQENFIENGGQVATFDTSGVENRTLLYVTAQKDNNCPYIPGILSRVVEMSNDTTIVACGENLRFIYSGDKNGGYESNGTLRHRFESSNGDKLQLSFNSLNLAELSHLWITIQSQSGADSIIYEFADNSEIPEKLELDEPFEIIFSSGFSAASDWSAVVSQLPEPQVAVIEVFTSSNIEFYDEVCRNSAGIYNDKYNLIPQYFTENELSAAVKVAGNYVFKQVIGTNPQTNCDSSIVLYLDVLQPQIAETYKITTNYGDPVVWYDSVISFSGTYEKLLTSSAGCDSIEILNVAIVNVDIPENVICKGDSAVMQISATFNVPDWLSDSYKKNFGIEVPNNITSSIDTALLKVFWKDEPAKSVLKVSPPGSTDYEAVVILMGDTFSVWHNVIVNQVYEKDTLFEVVEKSELPYTSLTDSEFANLDVSKPGIFSFKKRLNSLEMCDSIVTLILKVIDNKYLADSLCQLNDDFYFAPFDTVFKVGTQSGLFTHRGSKFVNGEIIDTIVYYDLTILPIYESFDTLQLCAYEVGEVFSYDANSDVKIIAAKTETSIYSESESVEIVAGNDVGDFALKMLSVSGCDSTIFLHVNVKFVREDTLYIESETSEIVDGKVVMEDYIFAGIDSAGTYVFRDTLLRADGCDSIVVRIFNVEQSCHITLDVQNVEDEICGSDGSVSVLATNYNEQVVYSIDGQTFQDSAIFRNLIGGSYTVICKDSKNCIDSVRVNVDTAETYAVIVSCPPTITDTLEYGVAKSYVSKDKIGRATASHTLDWDVEISNDEPLENLFSEGKNIITWIARDKCGKADTCYQEVNIVFPECPKAVDCEGNEYESVRIGSHCWTRRNIESTKYINCEEISCADGYFSATYPNTNENIENFGRLYCREAVINEEDTNCNGHLQSICPEGWYLPERKHFEELLEYPLQELRSKEFWLVGAGDNNTGFSALPAGRYNESLKRFERLLSDAYFWYSDFENGNFRLKIVEINYYCDDIQFVDSADEMSFSVRCVKEAKCKE